jgi:hypothetical protein
MTENASHRQHGHSDYAEWNPLSGAIAGGRHNIAGDSAISPTSSRPHTPTQQLMDENEQLRDKEQKELNLQADQLSSESSSTSNSVDDNGESSAIAKESEDSNPPSQSSTLPKEPAPSIQPSIRWKPEKLQTPFRNQPANDDGEHISREEDDSDDSDEDLTGCSGFMKRKLKMFRMRPYYDDEPSDWWFASTAAPLLAATSAPLANVLSIAALVTPWRMNVNDGSGGIVPDFDGVMFGDPRW